MLPRYCPECGAPIARPDRRPGGTDRALRLVCPECHARVGSNPALHVSGILTREGAQGTEVLLVRRLPEAGFGAGRYCLPGRLLTWQEDAREAAVRAVWDQGGLRVRVREAYDLHNNLHEPERPTVNAWFRMELEGEGGTPEPGAEADAAAFFPLTALPELAFPTDGLVLDRLGREGPGAGGVSPAAVRTELTAQLGKRRQKYRELLQAYTDELMRGAWINELHTSLGEATSPGQISMLAAEHLAGRREVDKVQVWFPGPPDRCDGCPWSDRCARDACLHLVSTVTDPQLDSEVQEIELAPTGPVAPAPPAEEERVPFLRGVPAGDAALQDGAHQAELPGAGAQPLRFLGFPLDVGDERRGVLGLISRVPIDANARRLLDVVARHVGTLIRNARLVEDLRAANNVKRSFIARLSHELKTPITAILGFAELLREELEAEGNALGADGAATIEASGRKLLGIVETILEIAKLESAAAAFAPERVALLDLAQERLNALREEAGAKGIELRVMLPEDPDDPPTVWADPQRVRQILDQLLANALKFTREGAIEVAVSQDERFATCTVRDTGIGIAPENHKLVFEVFTQVSESIHLEYGGLGLGLALAKVLVEKQGGRIWLESQPGQGSTFSFTLPRSASVG